MTRMIGQEPARDNAGNIIQDIVHYDNGVPNPRKSFIAPDGVPEGSRSSIDQETKDLCRNHHNTQLQQQPGKDMQPPQFAPNTFIQNTSAFNPGMPNPSLQTGNLDQELRKVKSRFQENKELTTEKPSSPETTNEPPRASRDVRRSNSITGYSGTF